MSKFDKLIDNASIQFDDILVKMRACVLWGDVLPLSASAHNLAMAMVSLHQAQSLEAEILNASSVCRGSTDPIDKDFSYDGKQVTTEEDAYAKAVEEHIGENGSLLKWVRKDKMDGEVQVAKLPADMPTPGCPFTKEEMEAFSTWFKAQPETFVAKPERFDKPLATEDEAAFQRHINLVRAACIGDCDDESPFAFKRDVIGLPENAFVMMGFEYEALKQAAQELKDAHDVLDGFNIPDLDADGKTPLRIRMQVHAMCEVDKVEARHRKHIDSVCSERDECENRHDATESVLAAALVERCIINKEVAELDEYLNSMNVAREGIAGILPLKERVRRYGQESLSRLLAAHDTDAGTACSEINSAHSELTGYGIQTVSYEGEVYSLQERIALLIKELHRIEYSI